jgi:hypothetical protein
VTPRQTECLALRDQGVPVKVIARKLGLSPNTVKDAITCARNNLRREGKLPPMPPMPSGKNYAENERKLLGLLGHTPMGSREMLVAMPELTRRQIERYINRLSKAGKIKSIGHGIALVWVTAEYYPLVNKIQARSDAAAARQRVAEDGAASERQAHRKKLAAKAIRQIVTIDTRKTTASVSIAKGLPGLPIITEKTIITIIQTPKGRYHVDMPIGSGVISKDWQSRRTAIAATN